MYSLSSKKDKRYGNWVTYGAIFFTEQFGGLTKHLENICQLFTQVKILLWNFNFKLWSVYFFLLFSYYVLKRSQSYGSTRYFGWSLYDNENDFYSLCTYERRTTYRSLSPSLMFLSQVDKVKIPWGVCGFLSRGVGGCKFFESEGGYPPWPPKSFRLWQLLFFTVHFTLNSGL